MSKPNIDVVVSGAKQAECTYKNVVLKGNHSFASQVTEPNCIYVIKWDFDLGGEEVTIPENCVLKFEGGSLSNGTIVCNTGCLRFAGKPRFSKIVFRGDIEGSLKASWFGAVGDGVTDDTDALQEMFDSAIFANVPKPKHFILDGPKYLVSNEIDVNCSYSRITGASFGLFVDNSTTIESTNGNSTILRLRGVDISLYNLRIGYESHVAKTESSVAVLYKSTDEIPAEGEYAKTDSDCAVSNCAVYNSYVGAEYWGVQIRFQNVMFSGIDGACLKFKEYAGGNRVYGGARGYKIINCGFHSVAFNGVKILDETTDGYGFQIQGCHDDCAGVFFRGNLRDSVISNNICYRLSPQNFTDSCCNQGIAIDAYSVKNSSIINNVFTITDQVSVPGFQTQMNCAIRIQESENILISDNVIGPCYFNSILIEKINAVTISNNKLSLSRCHKYTKDIHGNYIPYKPGSGETLVSAAMLLGTSQYQNNFANLIVNGNTIVVRGNDGIIAGMASNIFNLNTYQIKFECNIVRSTSGAVKGDAMILYDNIFKRYLSTQRTLPDRFDLSAAGTFLEEGSYHVTNIENYTTEDPSPISGNGVLVVTKDDNSEHRLFISDRSSGSYMASMFLDASTNRGWSKPVFQYVGSASAYTSNNVGILFLGKFPYFWNGSKFVEADGAETSWNTLVPRSGVFANKPSSANIYVGFKYFCTDRQTTEGATNGIVIYHKGNNVWVDALGRVVS